MSNAELLLRLRAHPDSARPSGEPDPLRITGLLGLRLLPTGGVVVEWHWGTRMFASQAELEGWLAGITPPSWS